MHLVQVQLLHLEQQVLHPPLELEPLHLLLHLAALRQVQAYLARLQVLPRPHSVQRKIHHRLEALERHQNQQLEDFNSIQQVQLPLQHLEQGQQGLDLHLALVQQTRRLHLEEVVCSHLQQHHHSSQPQPQLPLLEQPPLHPYLMQLEQVQHHSQPVL